MMKKIISALVLASLSSVAGLAQAEAVEIQSGVAITAGTGGDCEILRDRVTVNLSSKVLAAYNCDVDNNMIGVAACHESGSQKPTDIPCVGTEVTVDGETSTVYNDASCNGTAGQTFEISGRRVFKGRSTGGGVSAADLNSATCDMTALGGQDVMQ